MIEEFKNLQPEDTIIFTEDQLVDFFENDELVVTGVRVYSSGDDAEMVIVEMDEFYLITHNFESDEKCFAYQLIDEGSIGDLEDDGYKFLNEDDDFRHKIIIREDGKTFVYHPSNAGAIYGMARERADNNSSEPQEVSICEFASSSARLGSILIEREDDNAFIMQGFEISENDFELCENSE